MGQREREERTETVEREKRGEGVGQREKAEEREEGEKREQRGERQRRIGWVVLGFGWVGSAMSIQTHVDGTMGGQTKCVARHKGVPWNEKEIHIHKRPLPIQPNPADYNG